MRKKMEADNNGTIKSIICNLAFQNWGNYNGNIIWHTWKIRHDKHSSLASNFQGLRPHGPFWSQYNNPEVSLIAILVSCFLLVGICNSLWES
jgi:hypothetical protein